MKITLTYFKSTGKWYSEGSYETDKDEFEVFNEIKEMIKKGELPGLMKGPSDFHILVEGILVPRLIPLEKEKEENPDIENLLSDSVTSLDLTITQREKLVYFTRFVISPDNAIEILTKLYEFVQKIHRKGGLF